MEFISTSARQANREAIQEVQAEINQKKTPAVRLVSEIIQRAMTSRPATSISSRRPRRPSCASAWMASCANWKACPRPFKTHSSPASRFFPTWISANAARRRTADSWCSVGPRKVDMRVSTLPTQYGEKVVMRLLETNAPLLSFADLGFPQDIADRISQVLACRRECCW